MSLRLVVVLLALSVSASALAGHSTLDGTEVEFWETCSVVYGNMTAIQDVSDYGTSTNVTIDVRAVLTGTFDSMRHPEVTVPVHFGGQDDVINKLPPVKSHVLVVLQELPKGEYRIWESFMAFMPKGLPLVAVNGFDEKEVQEMIVHLRTLRKFKGKSQEAVKQGVELYPHRHRSE
jgi:hypothetical protein